MKRLQRTGLFTIILAPAVLGLLTAGFHRTKASAILQGSPIVPGPHMVPEAAVGGTRGPSALLFQSDGKRVYIAEQDENSVAVFDPGSQKQVASVPSGGEQPVGLALSPDGRTLAVTNMFSGSIGLIDPIKNTLRASVPLRGEPFAVAISRAGKAFITLLDLDQVAVVDLATAKIVERIPVGRRPRALAFTPNEKTLLCANLTGGSVSVIDVASLRERSRVTVPAINLRGMALTPDGDEVLVTGQQPHNDVPTDRPEAMWTNVLLVLRLGEGTVSLAHVVTLDTADYGAADPCGVVADPNGQSAYVALSGTHEVAVVPLTGKKDGSDIARVLVGANPRAIALRPDKPELWVGNHLGNSLAILHGGTTEESEVDLGAPTPSPNRRMKGRFLFASAHLTRGRHFSCETCHPDFSEDGLSWKFAHVHDKIDLRNTRDLRGNILLTPPYGWGGREEDFEVFVNTELEGLTRTHKLAHKDVHAFWDLVNETPLPPNPYRKPDGTLTVSALRGKALFSGEAGCVTCHGGDQHGGTAKRAFIGTTQNGLELDVPHLAGVYASAPYLHDGRATSLEEIFTKYNPEHIHGKADELTPAQLSDVLAYVREF